MCRLPGEELALVVEDSQPDTIRHTWSATLRALHHITHQLARVYHHVTHQFGVAECITSLVWPSVSPRHSSAWCGRVYHQLGVTECITTSLTSLVWPSVSPAWCARVYHHVTHQLGVAEYIGNNDVPLCAPHSPHTHYLSTTQLTFILVGTFLHRLLTLYVSFRNDLSPWAIGRFRSWLLSYRIKSQQRHSFSVIDCIPSSSCSFLISGYFIMNTARVFAIAVIILSLAI